MVLKGALKCFYRMREQAEASFAGTGVRITTEGKERDIGAALGSEAFKLSFV